MKLAIVVLLYVNLAASSSSSSPPNSTSSHDDDVYKDEIDWQLMNAAIGAGYWRPHPGGGRQEYVAWSCQALCNSHRLFTDCCNAIMGTNSSEYQLMYNLCTAVASRQRYTVPCGRIDKGEFFS